MAAGETNVGSRPLWAASARLIMDVLNVSDTAIRGRWPERLRQCGPVSGTSPGAVRDRVHGLVARAAVVCAISAVAALAVPVSVTV